MNFSNVEFVVGVLMLLLLALAGLAYLHRDKIKAAWTDFRAPKLDETFVKMHGEAIIRSFVDHLKPIEEKAAAAMTRANTAIKVATATAPPATVATHVETINAVTAQLSQLAQPEESMDMDKGVVGAGQLLSGWVLANWETQTAPVQAKRHADIMYLTQMAKKPGGNQVFEDVITGSQGEVNVVRNYAHTNGWDALVIYAEDGSGFADWTSKADPAIRAAAEASLKAYQAAHPANVHTYDFSRYYRK